MAWPGAGRVPWEKAVLGDPGGAGGSRAPCPGFVGAAGPREGPGLLSFAVFYWRKGSFLVPQVLGLDALEKVGK